MIWVFQFQQLVDQFLCLYLIHLGIALYSSLARHGGHPMQNRLRCLPHGMTCQFIQNLQKHLLRIEPIQIHGNGTDRIIVSAETFRPESQLSKYFLVFGKNLNLSGG